MEQGRPTDPSRRPDARGPRPDLGGILGKTPPRSPQAEMALLGALLTDPHMMGEILALVPGPEMFSLEAHGAIYTAIAEVWDQAQSGDLVQIVERLRGKKSLEAVGGPTYLVQLVDSTPSTQAAPHYARIVAEKFRLRRLIEAAEQIAYDAYQAGDAGSDEVKLVLDEAEAAIFRIAEGANADEAQKLSELLQDEVDRLDRAMDGERVTGISTGFHDLDKKTSGLHPGELIVIAGRPSMGKTSLALNLAEQIALGGRAPHETHRGETPVAVAFFSLEMSKEAVSQRLISAAANVDHQRLRTGDISMDEFERIKGACATLHHAPVIVDDSPALTVLQLRAKARRMATQHKIRCIMVDYLQLLTAPSAGRESRQNEVAAISRGIKSLARELRVPVVCLAQLNRGVENREGNRPRMSDLRESGAIEQDADIIMLLHREEYYHIGEPDWLDAHPEAKGKAELIIAKQRNGPTGVVEFAWDAAATRFKNYADMDIDPSAYERTMRAPASLEKPRHQGNGSGGFAGSGGGGGYAEYDAGGGSGGFGRRAEPKPFAPGSRSGPVGEFRDGGGPDREESPRDEPVDYAGADDEEPPF
ncbi:MAG: replicative DNA helicase [Phycisphaerales bacterium]